MSTDDAIGPGQELLARCSQVCERALVLRDFAMELALKPDGLVEAVDSLVDEVGRLQSQLEVYFKPSGRNGRS